MNEILAVDKLGAFCRHTHAQMKGAPGGPLAGLTFGVKDIYDIAGHRNGFGSPDWLRTHEAAARTAPVVRRLLDAGADMVGKTHTDEITWSLNGENAHYGTPVNVNAPGRIPGGSSSGSAAAVAGGLCDFALGSDTGGSVRAPASFCGIYGIRPTHGRVSLEGACPLAPSFDTCGWFARSADLLQRVGRVLLGAENAGAPRKLLLAQDAFALAGESIARALAPAVERVSALLGKPARVTVAPDGLPQWLQVFRVLQAAEAWAQHGAWVTRVKPVITVKSGRTTAGARAAVSHTGSMVALDAASESLLTQCGVLRCSSMQEMFTLAQALAHQPVPGGRRVAIVTTAGLHRRGDRPFGPGEQTYRVIPADTPTVDIVQSHTSLGFDRVAIMRDVNVSFPIDRLRELVARGALGAVAPSSYSFMGAQREVARIETETGPEVARRLREEGVDVALVTPT